MINGPECFAAWAPDDAIWSPWAKPVVFAQAPALFAEPEAVVPSLEAPGLPRPWDASAIVVDLPGARSVLVGLALAERGFRPVPLFNGTSGPKSVVPTADIERALGAGTNVLRRSAIAPDARPAFLIDANRTAPIGAGEPGRYDNRWVVLPQDFPSATFLRAKGIEAVTVIRERASVPDQDLTHVLLRWKEGGVRVRLVGLDDGSTQEDVSLAIPSGFRRLWYGAIALMGLRRSNAGGFGSLVPEQTRSTGFYG